MLLCLFLVPIPLWSVLQVSLVSLQPLEQGWHLCHKPEPGQVWGWWCSHTGEWVRVSCPDLGEENWGNPTLEANGSLRGVGEEPRHKGQP